MIEQLDRLPLAQYLRLIELAKGLDVRLPREISIESIQEDIERQLESSLPASRTGAGLRSYEDLKQEAEAISQVQDTIEAEIRPVASRLTPGFVEGLQKDYEEKWRIVQSKLELSERLDKEYRRSHEQEEAVLTTRRDILFEAHQQGVGLPSVPDLVEEIRKLEEAQEEVSQIRKRSAEVWAERAEAQLDRQKAGDYWEKALEQDDSPDLRARRDKHLAVLEALEDETGGSYDDLFKEARELFEAAARSPLESLSSHENDLRLAWEKCECIVQGLADYPYPGSIRHEADRLAARISAYNNRMWRARAIACMAQAEVDLAGDRLYQANESLAQARQAFALIWDADLQPSDAEKLEAIQRRIESKAGERTDGVVDQWGRRAQAYLDNQDAVAALNCVYAARALADGGGAGDESIQRLESLEDQALAAFSQEVNVEAGALAERALQFLSQEDRKAAFRWLEAALRLGAAGILSEPGFSELTDAYFESQSRHQRIESSLVQAEYRLAQDPRDRENLLAAEAMLAEAEKLLTEVGETDRLPEVEQKRKTLRARHRQSLTEELKGLFKKLDDACRVQEPTPPQMTETLSILKDLTRVLAKIEKARFTVANLKPHLQKVFDYYAQLQSDAKSEGDLNSAEGYSLSYMLLSKVGTWETDKDNG
jgi:hypothetical protein